MPAIPKTKAISSGKANAATSEGFTVANGPKTRIMMASIIRPNASMPESTDGLKKPTARSATPRMRATTNVLRIPLVRLLMSRLTSTVHPTTNKVPGVVRSGAGSRLGASSAVAATATGARLPARYSPLRRVASRRSRIDVNGNPMSPWRAAMRMDTRRCSSARCRARPLG